MRIFITGAGGFVGQHICRKLINEGHELTAPNSKTCDLTNASSLKQFNRQRFDIILHLAAWTQAGDFCLRHPAEQWIINQAINSNILSWWAENQASSKFFSMGTSCSYDPDLALTEDNYLIGTPIDSLYTYAMTKRMMEVGLIAMNKQYELHHLTVVPSTIYGPDYHTDGRQMHFIFDLITKIVRAKRTGSEVVLWGDGHQRRELVYVEDFTNDFVTLMNSDAVGIYNLGAGEEYTIRQFAEAICECVGFDPKEIKYDESKYVGARSKFLDNQKFSTQFGPLRRTPLKDGIYSTTKWIEENLVTL
jgi:GDP-L-fucose synthase